MSPLHWIGYALGVWPAPAGTPWTYQLWSGFVPALAVLAMAGGLYHKFKCHEDGCWRVQRHRHRESGDHLCRRHHRQRRQV